MRFLIFSLLLLLYIHGHSQTITVVDQQTREPLVGVIIYSENPLISTITNRKGQAEIANFQETNEIQIRLLGYKTLITSYYQIKESGFTVGLEQANLNLDQIVVSATRWRQTSTNVPSKVISISSSEAALQNPQTAADLLGVSGKVFIQKSQQGGGSPMIRGFATNRLIYTVDGVRMNTAIFRGGNIQNVINLDPFATANTEVLFGPGSVIYGSDAIGGVMAFQTLTPQLSLSDKPFISGNAVTRYSSANNEKTGHLNINIGWKKWAMVTSVSRWDYDHLRQGSKGPDDYIKNIYVQRQDSMDVVIDQDDPLLQIPSAYDQLNLMQKVRFKPNKNWDIQYGFHFSTTSSYGRYDRHNRFRNGTLRYAEWDYGPQKWMMHNLSLSHTYNHTFYDQLSLRFANQLFDESRIDRTLNRNDRTTVTEQVAAYSANLDFTKSVKSRHTFFYGIEYILNDVSSNGKLTDIAIGVTQNGPARYPNATWNSIGVYLNDEFRVSDRLTLQTGMRYNQFILHADFTNNLPYYPLPFTTVSINNGAITGSIGGVFRPSDSWVFQSNFGMAFRSPNVDDLGKVFDSEPGAVTVPNPYIKAEYAYNLDMGIAKIIEDRVKIDITGYYTMLQNALVRRDFLLNGQDSILFDGIVSRVQAIQNAAVAHVYGLQLALEAKLGAGFTFLSDFNYQVGREELDDGTTSPSRHAAPMFGVTRLRYKNNDLTIELNAQYQGEQSFKNLAQEERAKDEIYAKDKQGNNYSPAWHTLNLRVMYQFWDKITVNGGVENLTDQRYRPYSSGISGAGRNFVVSLKVNF